MKVHFGIQDITHGGGYHGRPTLQKYGSSNLDMFLTMGFPRPVSMLGRSFYDRCEAIASSRLANVDVASRIPSLRNFYADFLQCWIVFFEVSQSDGK